MPQLSATASPADLVQACGFQLISFSALDSDLSRSVLEWRNHPEVRRQMVRQEPIALDEHLAFIDSLETRTDVAYWLVKHGGEALGVIDLFKIQPGESAWWGYYLAPSIRGAAVGYFLEFLLLEVAFGAYNLKNLYCETRAENSAALNLHQRFGFREEPKHEPGFRTLSLNRLTWQQQREQHANLVRTFAQRD